ncbi:hypothetical protein C1645_859024 [Glomus cerebriforme]|uniref:HMG box domain-containing protein n=1 Tax=Glomus cerebriforme TaxID=658196 RepID=A0A397SNU3_9GLOM|nr:hypothetical protein C1645_859024 [Glomus cerebriforme]
MEELIFVEDGPTGKPAATSRNKAARMKRATNNHPNFKLPFPPDITPNEILKTKKNIVKSKAANSFMIYRQVYVRELQRRNLSFAMTDISGIISERWKLEEPHVKDFYRNLSQEANKLHKSKYGVVPVQSRKKNGPKKGKKNPINSKNETKNLSSTNADDINSNIFSYYHHPNPYNTFIPSPIFPYFNYELLPFQPSDYQTPQSKYDFLHSAVEEIFQFESTDYIRPDQILQQEI